MKRRERIAESGRRPRVPAIRASAVRPTMDFQLRHVEGPEAAEAFSMRGFGSSPIEGREGRPSASLTITSSRPFRVFRPKYRYALRLRIAFTDVAGDGELSVAFRTWRSWLMLFALATFGEIRRDPAVFSPCIGDRLYRTLSLPSTSARCGGVSDRHDPACFTLSIMSCSTRSGWPVEVDMGWVWWLRDASLAIARVLSISCDDRHSF